MDYKKVYDSLITKRQTIKITKGEKHHIIPKSLGGTNDITNLVMLTDREHIFAHILLFKIYPTNRKIAYAFVCMCNMNNSPLYIRGLPSTRLLAKSRELLRTLRTGIRTSYDASIYKFVNKNTLEIIEMNRIQFYEYSGLTAQEVQHILKYKIKYIKNWGIVLPDGTFSFDVARISSYSNEKQGKKIECEICHKIVDKMNYKRWHSDKCGKSQSTIKCIHCNRYFNKSRHTLYHGDKCKLKAP